MENPTPEGASRLRLVDMASLGGISMTSWPELEPMQNNLVNYGVTDNGIAIIELSSDSSGEPWTEGKTSVNTYTHAMMRDIDEAVLQGLAADLRRAIPPNLAYVSGVHSHS